MEMRNCKSYIRFQNLVSEHRLYILLLLSTSVFLALPAFISEGIYPSGIDTPAHIFKIDVMSSMLQQHGTIFGWSNEWYTGYPFLTIYAPVTYYLLLGFEFLFKDTGMAFNLFRVFLLFLTGFLTYLIVNDRKDKKISLVSGILAMSAIPIHNNLFSIGRVPFALGIVLYLASLHVLLQDEIYRKKVNRYHILLTALLTSLLVAHPMSAYLLSITAGILTLVDYKRVKKVGIRPIVFVGGMVLLFSAPYLVTFLRHSHITDPFWIRAPAMENLSLYFTRQFENYSPRYLGGIHLLLFILGGISLLGEKDRFNLFAFSNFCVFFLLFWSQNLGFFKYIPLNSQFDMPRFEILFSLWMVFVAAYGIEELFSVIRSWDISLSLGTEKLKWALAIILVTLVFVDVAPMIESSSNWSPEFNTSEDFGLNNSYRAIMVGGRHWDDYILPADLEVSNTFGWFQQADPYYNFTQTLQNSGGVWYPVDNDFPTNESKTLRHNLLRLSNTKYVLFGKDWVPKEAEPYVVASYYTPFNEENRRFHRQISQDSKFNRTYKSEALEIFEFQQDMSYCETVEPVWISDNYFQNARDLLSTEKAFPQIPVKSKGDKPAEENANTSVSCHKDAPNKITVETNEPAWVLVKESYYPFWKKEGGGSIYNGFGFMVVHVDSTEELIYDKRYSTGSQTLR